MKGRLPPFHPQSHKLPKDRIRPLTDNLSVVQFVAPDDLLEKPEDIRGLLASSSPKLSLAELFNVATEYWDRHHPEARAKRAEKRAQQRGARKEGEEQSIELATDSLNVEPSVNAQNSPLSEASPSTKLMSDLPEKFAMPKSRDAGRRTLPKALFYALITRDGFRCSYQDPVTHIRCNSQFRLEVDHKVPWSKKGETALENCRLLCIRHHRRVSYLEF